MNDGNKKIRLTKEVVFKDWRGNVLNVYAVGTELAFSTDMGHYWVTKVGGIYKDEAFQVEE